MDIRSRLAKIVGDQNFSDNHEHLKSYATDYSYYSGGIPNYVAWPSTSEEVSELVKCCNEECIPVVPCSSKVHFFGATIPKEGGLVIDMSRMDKILEIDRDNRLVRFEAGVNWDKLTSELKKEGFRVIMPLTPPGERSVLTDFLEREEPTNQVYDYGEPLQAMEVVWPTGEIFRMGSASVHGFPNSPSRGGNPSGPGLDFYRFFQCAQGTMGIVTWTNLKIESIPRMDEVFFAPVDDVDYAMEFLHRIMPRRIGQEVLLLNNTDLAAILARQWPSDFERLQSSLPAFTLILVVSGLTRRPEEKINYEKALLTQIVREEFTGLDLQENLPGFPGLGNKLLSILRNPWPSDSPYWKNRIKGASQSLFFHTRPLKSGHFVNKVKEIANAHGYPGKEIGIYIQPIEHNRACRIEFSFFYSPENANEVAMVRSLYKEAATELLKDGAVFTRPYGDLAPIVYEKAASYATHLRRLKKVFDPNNIMNPSNLCF